MNKYIGYGLVSFVLVTSAGFLAYLGIYPEFNCILVGVNITLTIINACLFWRTFQLANERRALLDDIESFVSEYLDRNGK